MKTKQHLGTSVMVVCALFALILDSKIALQGARDGISLCIQTVIPSLFPFFVLSAIMNKMLIGVSLPILRPIAAVCGVPSGAESVLLLGFLGGYPVGAKCIYEAYSEKTLSVADAKRLLGFCSNAGPAFIFGMGSFLFTKQAPLWILWAIHIVSAITVGCLLPNKQHSSGCIKPCEKITVSHAVERSIKTIAAVCGWVVIFRVIISFLQHWFLWLLPMETQPLISGILELSNGFYCLSGINNEQLRFYICAFILGFGGLCVAMQTVSVTKDLGIGMYFPGKILQGCISLMLAILLGSVLFNQRKYRSIEVYLVLFCFIISAAILYFLHQKPHKKKSSRNLIPDYV